MVQPISPTSHVMMIVSPRPNDRSLIDQIHRDATHGGPGASYMVNPIVAGACVLMY